MAPLVPLATHMRQKNFCFLIGYKITDVQIMVAQIIVFLYRMST